MKYKYNVSWEWTSETTTHGGESIIEANSLEDAVERFYEIKPLCRITLVEYLGEIAEEI
jgi:hypothetical protein